MVNRVLISSRGYVQSVELTPANAPAISEGGIGIFCSSLDLGVKNLLTVSKAKSCKKKVKINIRDIIMLVHATMYECICMSILQA